VLKILRGICPDLAGKKTDLVVSSALFERLLGMKMKLRPKAGGGFAQNFQEFQSIRDFPFVADADRLYRPAVYLADPAGDWHHRWPAGVYPAAFLSAGAAGELADPAPADVANKKTYQLSTERVRRCWWRR
jgi:hypothetical protein